MRRPAPPAATVRTLAGVLLACAVVATVHAARFLPALDLARPALAGTPPVIGDPSMRLARRVVLVIVDGLRLDVSRDLPVLNTLRARGIDAAATAAFPTLSVAGYVTLLTGVDPRWSGARTNEWRGPPAIDTLAARVRALGGSIIYATDRRTMAPMFGVPWEQGLPAYARGDVLVVVPAALDRAGHEHGGTSAAYRRVALDVDRALGPLVASLDLSRDAIIVTADHGHTDRGGHGGEGRDVVEVPLVLAGAGIRAGARIEQARARDVAPTVAALLGAPSPGHASGRVWIEALAIEDATRARLAAADRARHQRVAAATDAIARADADRITRWRGWRMPAALLALGALVGLVVLGARRRTLVIDRTIVVASIAAPLASAIALGLLPLPLAPPHLPGDRLSFALELSPYLAITAAVAAIAALCAVRARGDQRIAAACGFAATGLVSAALPALGSWAWLGEAHATTLPDPALVLAAPVASAALAVIAVAGAVSILVARAGMLRA